MRASFILEEYDITDLRYILANFKEFQNASDEQIIDFFNSLPWDIKLNAYRWEMTDTEVKDDIYGFASSKYTKNV